MLGRRVCILLLSRKIGLKRCLEVLVLGAAGVVVFRVTIAARDSERVRKLSYVRQIRISSDF